MLIGTLTALLIGAIAGTSGAGGGMSMVPGAEIIDGVDDLIEDDERRERAKGVAEEGNTLREETNETFTALVGRFEELTDSREATEADFEAVVEELDVDSRLDRILDLRFRLKNELTEEEWTTLYGELVVPE